MRITIVLGPFLPVPTELGGAVEKVHLLLAGAYRAGGHKVTILSRRYRDFAREEVVDGIRHIRLRSAGRSSSLAVNLVRDLVYSVRAAINLPAADVTITNGFFLPLVLSRRRAGRIYVQVGRYPKHQMFLYFRADRLQAVSYAVADAIVRQTPWLAKKVTVIGYAVPAAYFRSPTMRDRQKTILFVGRLAREKGIELLLRAVTWLKRHGEPGVLDGWKLRIIGPHEVLQGGDGAAYLGRLKTLANPLGSQCEFVGPVFDQQVLISEYQAGAVFVYPSLAEFGESLGLAPLEAMAAGCAVIVSNLRCFDDYVEDGVTGLKFDHTTPDPVEALAARLLYLISEERVLERIAEAGHHAAYRFHAEPIAARMLEDFASIVGDRPPAQSAFSTASGQARK